MNFKLVPAEDRHRAAVFDLSNSQDVRANSINPAPIPWEKHVAWYEKTIKDPLTLFLVAEDLEGSLLGQVRIALNNGTPLISASLAGRARGHGIAAKMLAAACDQYLEKFSHHEFVLAQIQTNNIASMRAFNKAGFHEFRNIQINSQDYAELRYLRGKGDRPKT